MKLLSVLLICSIFVFTLQNNFLVASMYGKGNCGGNVVQKMVYDIRKCSNSSDGSKVKYICGTEKINVFKCDENCENCKERNSIDFNCNLGYMKYTCHVERPVPRRNDHVAITYGDKKCKNLIYVSYVTTGCNNIFNASGNTQCLNGDTKVNIYRENDCKGEPINIITYEHGKCVETGPQSVKLLKCNMSNNIKCNYGTKKVLNVFNFKAIDEILNF